MHLTIKQQLNNLTKEELKILRELTHLSKNLVNETMYEIRQCYDMTGHYLEENELYKLMQKISKAYSTLNTNISQHIINKVNFMYKSYFALLKKKVKDKTFNEVVNIPQYLPKDGYYPLIIQSIPSFRKDRFIVPYSYEYAHDHQRIYINVPPSVVNKHVVEIRIIPRHHASYFEVHYVYDGADEIVKPQIKTEALAIDLGTVNFATCITTEGDSFIIDGRKLKSYIQWYNKRNAELEVIKSKQNLSRQYTKQQVLLLRKKDNRVSDFITKAAHYIINYCKERQIWIIVLGYSKNIQSEIDLGPVNNQIFTQIPYGQFKQKLDYLCKLCGITFVEQEESYTSKASFFDNDYIPGLHDDCSTITFSGKRVKRGLYKTSSGKYINADINGALNILKKSKVVPDAVIRLYNRGELNTPVRIRVHK